jgi:hypothetical protein
MKSAAAVVSGVAAAQWGLLTTAQAEAAGVNRSSLARLCEAGHLERLGQGVYLLAGAEDALTPLRAAWLSLAPTAGAEERLAELPGLAVVSHASAAALHRVGDLPHDVAEFIVPTSRRTVRDGIRLHHARLTAADVTVVDGLPATTIERTIADLLRSRRHGDPEHVARIVGDALIGARLDVDRLAGLLQPLASRYQQPNGDAFVAWLVELSGNGPTALAEKLSRTAAGRHVVELAAKNRLTPDAGSAVQHLITSLADWMAANPDIEQDPETASRAALANPAIAEAISAVRSLPREDLPTTDETRYEPSAPAVPQSTNETQHARETIDPDVVRAVTTIREQR